LAVTAIAGTIAVLGGFISPSRRRFSFSEPHMGTQFSVILYASDEMQAVRVARAAFRRIAELDQIMSDYRPDSELNRLCARAAQGPVVVSEDLYTVLERSLVLSRATQGAFDVTVGPLVQLWRRARRQHQRPAAERLAEARRRVGYQHVRLDPKRRTVELTQPHMRLDLGGIGKGYALDEALEVVQSYGIDMALIVGGGDIRVGDPPPGQNFWRIGVPHPSGPPSQPVDVLGLAREAIATSGDAEQYVVLDGVRYSHIVDPIRGIAVRGPRQASVLAADGTTADALATALCVMEPERAFEFARQQWLAARIIYQTDEGQFKQLETAPFRARILADASLDNSRPDETISASQRSGR
jgi:thiamine biosynthesis lipoprotein